MTIYHTRPLRRLGVVPAVFGIVLASVALVASPAGAVSSWSGKDPYHDYGPGKCAEWTNDNHVVWMDATYVYDGSTWVGTGYLAYSPMCQTNWGEFYYHDHAAWDQHTVVPSAWEAGKTGTDQYSQNLNDFGPVYTLMVDGRSTACAGAQLYELYPSHHWVTWYTFGCE